MRLSKRIYRMAEMINQGETAADIGTDHGYVPMLLFRGGVSPRVIMSDISEGSLSKARETFRQCGIHADERDFRTGDGLETIGPGEVDAVIIGGLGGHTIASILDADTEKSKSFGKLVLQPRKHSGTLRHYLYTRGWDIITDTLAPEGKFECEIIVAAPSDETERQEPYPADDIRWKYPRYDDPAISELACRRVEWKITSIDEQIENLRNTSGNAELTERLQNDRAYLEGLINVYYRKKL